MKFALLGRQALMGVMAVALVAGMSVKTFAAENLLNKVKERGTLLVGLEGTYPPFSFQGDDGKLTGFEVEFAEELAKHLGVKASLKPTKWDGMLASLDSKRIDVVINQVTISDERKKKYDFSTPYTVSGIQALVKKGNEGGIKTAADLKGKKVGVGLGTNYEEWLRQNVQGVDIRTYDDDPTKYQDLRVGRIDAILVDRLAALDQEHQVILVDCLTIWMSNLLLASDPDLQGRECLKLLELLPKLKSEIIMVSNETGLGVIPLGEITRRFVDESGRLHQALGQVCQHVVFCVAGFPMQLKGVE